MAAAACIGAALAAQRWVASNDRSCSHASKLVMQPRPAYPGKYTERIPMSDYYSQTCPGPLFAPRAPSVNGSATSAAASDALGPATLNAMQRQVLEYIRDHGPSTDEQIATGCDMNPSTARPRRIELVRRGLVVEAGERRTASGRKAVVWRVAT